MSFKGTYSDIKINFRNGGSIIVTHEEFLMINAIALEKSSDLYHRKIDNCEDGIVPVGLIRISEISHTEPFIIHNV